MLLPKQRTLEKFVMGNPSVKYGLFLFISGSLCLLTDPFDRMKVCADRSDIIPCVLGFTFSGKKNKWTVSDYLLIKINIKNETVTRR